MPGAHLLQQFNVNLECWSGCSTLYSPLADTWITLVGKSVPGGSCCGQNLSGCDIYISSPGATTGTALARITWVVQILYLYL